METTHRMSAIARIHQRSWSCRVRGVGMRHHPSHCRHYWLGLVFIQELQDPADGGPQSLATTLAASIPTMSRITSNFMNLQYDMTLNWIYLLPLDDEIVFIMNYVVLFILYLSVSVYEIEHFNINLYLTLHDLTRCLSVHILPLVLCGGLLMSWRLS